MESFGPEGVNQRLSDNLTVSCSCTLMLQSCHHLLETTQKHSLKLRALPKMFEVTQRKELADMSHSKLNTSYKYRHG